jgi:hypothetical protein
MITTPMGRWIERWPNFRARWAEIPRLTWGQQGMNLTP